MSGLARNTDPDTSHAAAESVDTTRLEMIVLDTITACGSLGATWDELHTRTGLNKASISPRFRPLCNKNLIKPKIDDSGKKITRPGVAGRAQTVWIAL